MDARTQAKPDVSIIFDLGACGEPADIARDKARLLGEAVWQQDLRKAGRKSRRWRSGAAANPL